MVAVPQLKPFSLPQFPVMDEHESDEPLGPLSLAIFSPHDGTSPNDDDLTSLNWLQKPGVLNSMCNALTGSPHCVNPMGCRSSKRKPRSVSGKSGEKKDGDDVKKCSNSAEKMLNVVLSVRNKRYDGEDAHKPPLSFACMIFMALESSPTKTLPVKQIYEWIQWKFPYYATALPGWKNSIRHNLSLNKCFQKVEKLSRKVCLHYLCIVLQYYREFSDHSVQ